MTTIKIAEVCQYLRPNGGWATNGYEFEDITFVECEPFTKADYEKAIPLAQAALQKAKLDKAAAKEAAQAKLEALGLTVEDLKALGL
jgi:hypothetical protein